MIAKVCTPFYKRGSLPQKTIVEIVVSQIIFVMSRLIG